MNGYTIVLERNLGAVREGLGQCVDTLGIDLTTLIPAVDGLDLAADDLIVQNLSLQDAGWARGAAGCLLSHIKALSIALDDDQWPAMVLEEDVATTHPDAPGALALACRQMEQFGADMVMLGGRTTWTKPQPIGPCMSVARPSVFGSHCYLVTRQGALQLLDQLERYVDPVDRAVGRLMAGGNVLVRIPQLVVQRIDRASNITGQRAGTDRGMVRPDMGRPAFAEGVTALWPGLK